MKKAILLLLLLCEAGIFASAQKCNTDFLGTKTLYKNSATRYTPPPAGYLPVFINHVGRHGARHLTKDINATLAYALLLQADSVNVLTEKGKKLMLMVKALQKVEKGKTKSISAEGADELKGLGERMYANYPSVFKGLTNLKIATTKEVRTRQSADAFLQGLYAKMKDTAKTSFYNDDTNLRFYDLSPAYKKFENDVNGAALMLSLEKEERLNKIDADVTGKIFTADFIKRLNENEQAKFVSDIFGFTTIVYSLANEVKQAGYAVNDLDFSSLFTCDELQKLALLDDVDEYLKKGPGTNNDGIQVKVAVPLLVEFINSADDFIKNHNYNARLRFAHAETIAPFAALMQISVADKPTTKLATLNNVWKASEVIPLSSNIQWIFYKNRKKTGYLVKILFNEKEACIDGLDPHSFPYYKWNDLRALYIAKLNKLKVRPTDNMGKYLNGIQ